MSFGQSVKYCFNHYASFDGRASRSEFWWFYLFTVIASGIPYIIGAIFIVASAPANSYADANGPLVLIGALFYIIAGIISLATVIPLVAAGCRRMHDRGTSGWLQLLLLVPCLNLVVLVFWALDGTPGANAYGEGPAKF
ncbi:MAG: DUF805 domain-containing protein [Candidatus Nanopelagicales bacterium]|nr:DUF805 domain-containing protein [Candidatus Nanopelagicales bacterium]